MNDANFSACRFSTDIVPYMYGEMAASESSAFESHLVKCVECTDDFAALAGARYDVYEWKKIGFDPLATPRFEIPFEEETVVVASASWSDKLRATFAAGWTAPAFALGGLMILSIFAASFILSKDKQTELASNNSTVPTVESAPFAATVSENREPSDATARPAESGKEAEAGARRISRPSRIDQRRAARTKQAQPRAIEVRAESARNKRIAPPTLNEYAEDEDTSLRLAELLEEIETSD